MSSSNSDNMYNYRSSSQDNNEWAKKHKRVSPYDKPWTQPTPLKDLNPAGDDKKWEHRNKVLESLSNAYIEGPLRSRGVAISNDVRQDLHDFYNVNNPELIESTLSKIYVDPRTLASVDPNRPNSYYIHYNKSNNNNK